MGDLSGDAHPAGDLQHSGGRRAGMCADGSGGRALILLRPHAPEFGKGLLRLYFF